MQYQGNKLLAVNVYHSQFASNAVQDETNKIFLLQNILKISSE